MDPALIEDEEFSPLERFRAGASPLPDEDDEFSPLERYRRQAAAEPPPRSGEDTWGAAFSDAASDAGDRLGGAVDGAVDVAKNHPLGGMLDKQARAFETGEVEPLNETFESLPDWVPNPSTIGPAFAGKARDYVSGITKDDVRAMPATAEEAIKALPSYLGSGVAGVGEAVLDTADRLGDTRIASFEKEGALLDQLDVALASGEDHKQVLDAYLTTMREGRRRPSNAIAQMARSPMATPEALRHAVNIEMQRVQRRRQDDAQRLATLKEVNVESEEMREALGAVNTKFIADVAGHRENVAQLGSPYAMDVFDFTLEGGKLATQMAVPLVGQRTALSRIGGAMLGATHAAGSQYGELVRNGMSPEDALQRAAFTYLTEQGPEQFSMDRLMGPGGARLMKRFVNGVFVEGGTESTTELLNIAGEYGLFDEDISFDESINRVFKAFAMGAALGGPASALVGARPGPSPGAVPPPSTHEGWGALYESATDTTLPFEEQHAAAVELEKALDKVDSEISSQYLDRIIPVLEEGKKRDKETAEAREAEQPAEEVSAASSQGATVAKPPITAFDQSGATPLYTSDADLGPQTDTSQEAPTAQSDAQPADGAVDGVLDRYGFVTGFRTSEVLNDPNVSLDSKLEQVDRAAASLLEEDPQLAARFRREMYGVLQETAPVAEQDEPSEARSRQIAVRDKARSEQRMGSEMELRLADVVEQDLAREEAFTQVERDESYSKALDEARAVEPTTGVAAALQEARRRQTGAEVSPEQLEVDVAANEAATSDLNDKPQPTQAQVEGDDYETGELAVGGLPISIENPAGSTRSGTDAQGAPWETRMEDHYGFLPGTQGAELGADGQRDPVDVFVGPGAVDEALDVYVIDQQDPDTKQFDEHKVMVGYASLEEAEAAYRRNYDQGDASTDTGDRIQGITPMSRDYFAAWTSNPARTAVPAADDAGRALLEDGNQVMFARSRRRLGSKHPSIESLPDDQKEVSSVPLLDSEQDLERLKTAQITSYLQKRTQAALGGARNEKTPENLERVAQLLAAETQYAVAQPGNAKQWYGEAIKRAQRAAASVFPEIGTSQLNRTAFNYALAVTSNGQKVDLNAKQALQVYQQYRETGVMPVFGNGERTQAMKDHFRLYNRLNEELGQDAFMRFLNTQFTVKELTSAGFDVTGDNMGQLVPGSAILGPKIGGAFFANLQGNRNTLTMDLWFMRTWGRMTGSLKLDFEAGRVRNNLVRMRRALQKESERAVAMGVEQADIDLALSKPNRPSTADELNAPDAALLDIANDIYDQWQLGGHKDPDEFYRSSRELHKAIVKAVETPGSGSDRQFMRDTVQRAVGILGERGIGTTAADMQALLWYGEKDLYAKFGSGNTGRTDYEGGIKKGIEELGLAGDANVDGGGQSPAGQVTGRDRIGGKASSFTPNQRERFLEQQRARQLTQRLSAEIEPGEGAAAGFTGYDQLSREQQQEVTTEGVKDAFKRARSVTKARGKVRVAAAGGFEQWVAPSVQMDLVTTNEQAVDTADAMGYLMRQTSVWVNRPDTKGKSLALDIMHKGLESDADAQAFWDHIRGLDDMLVGYAPIPKKNRNALGGVRIIFPAKYNPDYAELRKSADKLAKRLDGVTTEYFGVDGEVDIIRTHVDDQENDWNEHPDGNEYLQRLRTRHGSEVQGRLDGLRTAWEGSVQGAIDRRLYPERFQDEGAGQADQVAEPKAKRTQTRPRGGSVASEVRAQVRAIDKGLKSPLPTTVVQSYEDIPPADRKRVEAAGLTEFDAVFLPTPDGPDVGKVIMVADKLRDPEAVERIYLRHESNHGGLRRLAGPKLTPLMLAAYNDNKQAMDEWAAEAGVDTSRRSGKLTAAEEFIVEMAERGETNSLMQNVFAVVRDYLRRAGFKLQLTDSDLRLLVAQAGKQIGEGRSWVPEGAIRYGESLEVFTERGTGQPMYARTKPPEWIGDEDATRDKFREIIQDRMISLRNLEDRVAALKGSPLTEAERAYLMEERFHGRAGHQVEEMERNLVNPITDAMRAGDLSLTQVGEYLHARTAVETNTQMAKINARALAQRRAEGKAGDRWDTLPAARRQQLTGAELKQISLTDPDLQNLSGMSNAEALEVMMRGSGNPHLDTIAQHVDRMTAAHRQRLLDQGLADQQTIDNWTGAYKHYVPLHRDMEADTSPLPGSGQRFQVAGRESQFRKGSTIPVKHDEILSHLVSQHATGIVRAEKNIVGKGLLELAKNNPDADYWDVGTQFTVEEADGKGGVRRFKKPASAYRQDDSAFIVKVDGVEHAIRFKTEGGKRVAAAMKGIGAERMGRFGQGMSRVMRHLSFVNTSFSLPFIPTNYIRDFSAAAINLQGSVFSKGGGSKAKVMLQAMPLGPAMLGIADYQLRKDKATHPWAKTYKEFLETGGGTSWANAYNSIEQLTGTLEAEAKRSARSPVRALTAFMKAVEGANTVAESAVRLSLYKNAVGAKFTPTQAASMAKNITINFNRKGTRGTWLNNYTLFFNASVQGSQVLLSNARRPQVKVAMAGIAALGAFLSILNRVNGGEDEEGVNRYDKIPDWERNNNLILMDWRPGHEGEYFKMPLPYGYNVFHVAGDALGGAASSAMGLRRDFKVTQEAGRLLEAFTDAFSPVGSPVTPGQLLSPTLGDPLMRIIENKDYAGRDLAPKKNPYKDEPNYHRAWQSTWPIYSDIAEFLNNDVGGGDPVTPSFEIFGFRPFDMSPEWISGLVEFGLGSGGMALVKGGRRMALGDETPPGVEPDPLRQTIFERRFRGVENRYATRTLFFDALKDVEQTVERTELIKSDPELARAAKRTPQYKKLRTKAKDARALDKKLWTKIKAIQENNRISDEEKDRRIKRERAKQERNYHRFNKWYMDAVHPHSTNWIGDKLNETFREAA